MLYQISCKVTESIMRHFQYLTPHPLLQLKECRLLFANQLQIFDNLIWGIFAKSLCISDKISIAFLLPKSVSVPKMIYQSYLCLATVCAEKGRFYHLLGHCTRETQNYFSSTQHQRDTWNLLPFWFPLVVPSELLYYNEDNHNLT